ncbi:MAG: hypothetical protein V3V25_13725 [Paracoccaceae bacterium]
MKTPWHIWLIGIVSLLWNAGGAYDYVMTVSKNTGYIAQFTPEQLAYFSSFPSWMMFSWALGVWAAVLGSLLLLLRSGFAVMAFALSLVGLAGSLIYNFILTDVDYLALVGSAGLWFTVAIVVVAILLYLYARTMRQRGVLS